MSIWATSVCFESDDHANGCAVWVPLPDDTPAGQWHMLSTLDGKKWRHDDTIPCTCRCGPIRHLGSHVVPTEDAERAGVLGVCHIPGFIGAPGEFTDAQIIEDDLPPRPWLRVWLAEDEDAQTVILDRGQVSELGAYLAEWLELTEPLP